MSWKMKIIIIVVSLLVIVGISGVAYTAYDKYMENQEALRLQQLEQEKIAYEERVQREKEEADYKAYIDSLDLYGKVSEGVEVNILTIGNYGFDEYGNLATNPGWNRNIKQVLVDLGASINETYLPLNNGSILWGWQLSELSLEENADFDLVIIESSVFDEEQLSSGQYKLVYESLVRYFKSMNKKVEIYSVVSGEEGLSKIYDSIRQSVDIHYDIPEINYSYGDNMLYTGNFESIIRERLEGEINLAFLPESLGQVSGFDNYTLRLDVQENHNFTNYTNYLICENEPGYLTYETDLPYVFLTYSYTQYGGNITVIVNDEVLYTIDTSSETTNTKSIFISEEEGLKSIRLEASCSAGESVQIFAVGGAEAITNQ